MRRPYSDRFDPPAPVVSARLRAPGRRTGVLCDALVDSGADLCGVPEEVAQRLDLPPVRAVQVAGFRGAAGEAVVYRVDLDLEGASLAHVEALAIGRPYALIGRNVLRRFVVRLDGPRRSFELRRAGR